MNWKYAAYYKGLNRNIMYIEHERGFLRFTYRNASYMYGITMPETVVVI